ncbi:hypothetical protein TIFTF001_004153 [Ficus carica]|uniref:Uncharacterized protein n=1 Tax=Ficus carica TaxID=3494 RepID=A0AA88A3B5_FICCA|nr:hypothetical protein TIFTF001_004153 [Ficus carica]
MSKVVEAGCDAGLELIVYDRLLKRVAPRKKCGGSRLVVIEAMFFIKILPFCVVITTGMCPAGCEWSLMALMGSVLALALMLSSYLGVALAGFVGDDFSGFPMVFILIRGSNRLHGFAALLVILYS